jgi:hypothetical protein
MGRSLSWPLLWNATTTGFGLYPRPKGSAFGPGRAWWFGFQKSLSRTNGGFVCEGIGFIDFGTKVA